VVAPLKAGDRIYTPFGPGVVVPSNDTGGTAIKILTKAEFENQTEVAETVMEDRSEMLGALASDTQVGGDHYSSMAIQPAEFIHKNGIDFFAGNVIKYLCRYKTKGGKQDLEKARHYIDLLIEKEYPNG